MILSWVLLLADSDYFDSIQPTLNTSEFPPDLLDALYETSLIRSVPFPRWQMACGKNSPFSGCWVLSAGWWERPKTVGMGREGCSKLAGQGMRKEHVWTPSLCNSPSIDQESGC